MHATRRPEGRLQDNGNEYDLLADPLEEDDQQDNDKDQCQKTATDIHLDLPGHHARRLVPPRALYKADCVPRTNIGTGA